MVASIMAGCRQQTVYSRYIHTPTAGWDKEDVLRFTTMPMRTDADCEEQVGVCISSDYPFADLSLIVEQTRYPAHETTSDTIYCRLMDEHGRKLGAGFSQYQNEFPVRRMMLSAGDSLAVSIRHNMKRETLPGIVSIGLTIDQIPDNGD